MNFELKNKKISFRPVTAHDDAFLLRLYAGTREDELALTNWSDMQKQQFCAMQYQAQKNDYFENYKQAEFSTVLLDGKRIGRLYLDVKNDEIRIIDIALLKEYRNQGIGTDILRAVLELGTSKRLPVRIHVENFNPALRLYRRLGFKHVNDNGVYRLMEWVPEKES